ncbi:MAG: hypothetical protein QHC79_22455 [Pseudosphingobacterium sp.]|nr:hypothetical protein [Pseudosphingobacterium sp.]
MKNIIKTVCLLLLSLGFFMMQAQEISIPLSDVAIMKAGVNSKGVLFGQSPQQLISVLGNPTKVEDFFFEMENTTGKAYIYGQSKFYFLADKLESFDIYDPTIAVGTVGGSAYKVGDKLTVKTERIKIGPGNTYSTHVTKSFKNYPLDTKAGIDRNLIYKARSYANVNNSDYYVNILFDQYDKIINITLHGN